MLDFAALYFHLLLILCNKKMRINKENYDKMYAVAIYMGRQPDVMLRGSGLTMPR